MLVEAPAGYLRDMAVLATAGSYSSPVFFDAPDEEILDGRVETKRYQILFPAYALGALAWKSQLQIEGTTYSVLEVHDLDDGAWQRADLELLE